MDPRSEKAVDAGTITGSAVFQDFESITLTDNGDEGFTIEDADGNSSTWPTGVPLSIGGPNPKASTYLKVMATNCSYVYYGGTIALTSATFSFLTADYTATQINLIFRLPSGQSVTVNWGDGNTSVVNGNDAVDVSVTSNYSSAGSYSITLTGDHLDLTKIDCASEDVSGDVSGWSALTNLTELYCNNTSISGDVSGWSALTNLTELYCYSTSVSGDISSWSALTNLTILWCYSTSATGDVSSWSTLTSLTDLRLQSTSLSGDVSSWSTLINLTNLTGFNTSVDFDSSSAWTSHNHQVFLYDCAWTSTQVDNALIAFAAGSFVSKTIRLDGTNAARTAASDAAVATLTGNGNTVITS
jgi:hypothetical protein